jgi:hypothetical protein
MVKHMPFKHYDLGSNPKSPNGYRLMVDLSSSKRYVPIRFRLAIRVSS